MTRALVTLAVVAGCWRASTPETTLTNQSAAAVFVMTARGVAGFDAKTEATETALQARVPGLRVTTNDLGGDSGLVFDVFEGTERLFYVVPDDVLGYTDEEGVERTYAKTVFAVFAVSPKVRVEGRSWQVGSPFGDAKGIDVCECWGDHQVTACFRRGAHVRVIFEAPCDDAERDGPRAMLGKPIARIMWKRDLANDQQPMLDEPSLDLKLQSGP